MNIKPTRYFILVLFFVAGFLTILTETVLASLLHIWLGYAAFAQVFVLVAYMAGMALGASKASKGMGSPAKNLKLFGLTTILSGVVGLIAIPILQAANGLSKPIASVDWPWLNHLFRYLTGLLIVLPPAILSGYSFPLMLRSMGNTAKNSVVPQIYGVNALGGTIGALLSGFYLIGNYPHGSIALFVAGAAVLVGIASFASSQQWKPEPSTANQSRGMGKPSKKLYILAFVAGMVAFAMQVSLLRLLTLILGASFRSLEIMLAVYIAGMALGSMASIRHSPNAVLRFALLMAPIAGVVSLPFYDFATKMMASALAAITRTPEGWVAFNFITIIISITLVFLPAFFMGMILPALMSQIHQAKQGKMYAVNAIGCGLGAVFAQQIAFPLMGVWNTLTLAMVFLLLIAAITLSKKITRPSPLPLVVSFSIAVLFFWILSPNQSILNSGVFRSGKSSNPSTVLFHQDGKTASVAITVNKEQNMTLLINGKPDAAIGMGDKPGPDEPVEILLGALPLSLTQSPDNVFVIGLGSGLTAHTVLSDQRVKSLEVAEIEPAVMEASRNFGHRVAKAYYDQRCTIKIGDARTLLATTQKTYNLIISEPSNPWVNGMGSLFTVSFYKDVKARLAKDGLFTQWMHLYESDIRLVALVVKSLDQVFDDYALYFADDSNILIVAGQQVAQILPTEIALESTELKQNLARIGILSAADLAFRKLGSKKWLNPYFTDLNTWETSYNSDLQPLLENKAVKARFLELNVEELHQIFENLTPNFEASPRLEAKLSPFAYRFGAAQDFYKAHKHFNAFLTSLHLIRQPQQNQPIDSSQLEASILEESLLLDALQEDFTALHRFASRSQTDTLAAILNNQLKRKSNQKEIGQLLRFYQSILSNNHQQILVNGQTVLSNRGFFPEKITGYVEFQLLLSYYKLERHKEGIRFWHNLCNRREVDTRLQVVAALLNQLPVKSK